MSANYISEPIDLIEPAGAQILIVRDDKLGTATFAVQVGRNLTTLKVNAKGWRSISTALGIPPDADFKPNVRQCRVCGKTDQERKSWAAANVCACCINLPVRDGAVAKKGRS